MRFRLRLLFAVEHVRVPSVQQPAGTLSLGILSYRDGGVPGRVPRGLDESDVSTDPTHGRNRVKPVPGFILTVLGRNQPWTVGSMRRHESGQAGFMVLGGRVGDGPKFGRCHVYVGAWEIGQSTGVVAVQMCQCDVPDVIRLKSERDHLTDRRFVRVQRGLGEYQKFRPSDVPRDSTSPRPIPVSTRINPSASVSINRQWHTAEIGGVSASPSSGGMALSVPQLR